MTAKKTIQLPITVENPNLGETHKRIAWATILIPAIATIIAIIQASIVGVQTIDTVLLVVFFVLTNLGIEFGLHRHLAHKAFETIPFIQILFIIFGSMAAQGRVLYWVASHRRHHVHSDTCGDPHSPHIKKSNNNYQKLGLFRGLLHAHFGHMVTDEITNCSLFAPDLIRNPVLMKLNDLYIPLVVLGLFIPALLGGLLTFSLLGFFNGLLWGGLVRMFLVHQVTWSVASISHRFGSAPFSTGDYSKNNFFTALLSFGSGWQNNHHAFPGSAFIGLRWWQIDIAAWLISILKFFGLVWNVKKPSSKQIRTKLTTNIPISGID